MALVTMVATEDMDNKCLLTKCRAMVAAWEIEEHIIARTTKQISSLLMKGLNEVFFILKMNIQLEHDNREDTQMAWIIYTMAATKVWDPNFKEEFGTSCHKCMVQVTEWITAEKANNSI